MQDEKSRVIIILCTYNGEKFLREQLQSIANQTYDNWYLFISDDGSQDNTIEILEEFQKTHSDKVIFTLGPKKGFCFNFLSAICRCPNDAKFFAFSDQDDIWPIDKLQRSINWLSNVAANTPALYCSRTQLVAEDGVRLMGVSPLFSKPPSFANAIVQSIAGGNTMVINKSAYLLVKKAGDDLDIVSHDWWIYMLVTSVGGRVFYDPIPTILYRQHSSNVIGSNASLIDSLYRFKRLLRGDFFIWNNRNIIALSKVKYLLIAENKKIFDQFVEAREKPMIFRLINFYKAGIYRQTLLGNLGLFIGAIFNKI